MNGCEIVNYTTCIDIKESHYSTFIGTDYTTLYSYSRKIDKLIEKLVEQGLTSQHDIKKAEAQLHSELLVLLHPSSIVPAKVTENIEKNLKAFSNNNNKLTTLFYIKEFVKSIEKIETNLTLSINKELKKGKFFPEEINSKITSNIRATYDYSLFIKQLELWYTLIQMTQINFAVLDFLQDNKMVFNPKKFELIENLHFSVKDFMSSKALKATSYICRTAKWASHFVTKASYLNIILLIACNCTQFFGRLSSMSLLSTVLSNPLYTSTIILGSIITNNFLDFLTSFFDRKADSIDFNHIQRCIKELNLKLTEIHISTLELIKLILISNFERLLTKEEDNDNEDFEKKILTLKLLIKKHIESTNDLTESDLKEIELETIDYLEKEENFDCCKPDKQDDSWLVLTKK